MSRPEPAPFVPLAADLARCALMIRRGTAAPMLETNIRRSRAGVKRGTSAEAVLTLTVFALQHYKHARPAAVLEILDGLLPADVIVWLGLTVSDGLGGRKPISVHQWRNFWRIVHEHLEREELLDVTNALLLGWTNKPPLGDTQLFDATAHATPARPIDNKVKRRLRKENSPDLLLKSERRTLSLEEQLKLRRRRRHRALEGAWGHATRTYSQRAGVGGYHAHPVVCASTDQQVADAAPTLVVATDLTPASGYSAADELITLLNRIDALYGTDFTVIADRDYSHKLELWHELRNRGRRFAFDLREEQLLKRGEHGGALLLQGNCLCPGTPQVLHELGARPMTKKKDEPNPDYWDWVATVERQMPYRCHVRSRRATGLNVACPALSPSPKVICKRRKNVEVNRALPTVLDPPEGKVPICDQRTVFVPDAVNDLRQTWAWAGRSWMRMHRAGRSHDEGVHGELKNPNGYDLRRHVTNSSKAAVVAIHLALVQALFNLDKLRAWVEEHPHHPFSVNAATDPLLGPDALAIAWLEGEITRWRG